MHARRDREYNPEHADQRRPRAPIEPTVPPSFSTSVEPRPRSAVVRAARAEHRRSFRRAHPVHARTSPRGALWPRVGRASRRASNELHAGTA
tara:strand:+ start:65 stop:340 length:276 start_codon:yes stop_codon:yes gene_type:complete